MKIWKSFIIILFLELNIKHCLNILTLKDIRYPFYKFNFFFEKRIMNKLLQKRKITVEYRILVKKRRMDNMEINKNKSNINNEIKRLKYRIFFIKKKECKNRISIKKKIRKLKIIKLLKIPIKIKTINYINNRYKIRYQKIKDNVYTNLNILAPKNSYHEKKNKEILKDPIKNYPWGITIPFHETINPEDNPYYNFLKSEWAYLNYKVDVRNPCGKLEGGLENYDGKGIKLNEGKDRQRYSKIDYHLDHGVQWRKFNTDKLMRFDLDPDGNQDMTFLETEEDLEYRQWGNWNYNCAKENTQLNSAWRDPVLSKDLSNMIYPWTHKAHENHVIPYGYRGPSGFIPEIALEWAFAARGFFGGYFDDPNWIRIKNHRAVKKLLLEWYDLNKSKRNFKNDKVKLKDIDTKINKIKFELFGISNRKKYPSEHIKLINEYALIRATEMLLHYILDPANDPDYQLYFLDRYEPIDYIGGGNNNCSDEEIKNKTVVLNMCIYSLKPQHESYSLNMTIDEMAEFYHYFMTEIRQEGRLHCTFEDPVEEKYLCYELEKERKKFPALISLYKPLWTNKKYGEEFGDCLQEHEKLKKRNFINFNKKLKTTNKKKLCKKDMEQYNYVDDYEYFNEQYD